MGIITKKIEEFKTGRKFNALYETMTRSNYKGDLVDCYLIEMLYATMTVDLVNGSEELLDYNPDMLRDFAKEVVRIFNTEDTKSSMFSMANWCMALMKYMRENNLTYSDIHKKNTYELREDVRKYLNLGEE